MPRGSSPRPDSLECVTAPAVWFDGLAGSELSRVRTQLAGCWTAGCPLPCNDRLMVALPAAGKPCATTGQSA